MYKRPNSFLKKLTVSDNEEPCVFFRPMYRCSINTSKKAGGKTGREDFAQQWF